MYLPICDQANSVKPPINCGVALMPNLSVSSSTILPIANQSAAFRRFLQRRGVWLAFIYGLVGMGERGREGGREGGGDRRNVFLLLPKLRQRCRLWLSCFLMLVCFVGVYVCRRYHRLVKLSPGDGT